MAPASRPRSLPASPRPSGSRRILWIRLPPAGSKILREAAAPTQRRVILRLVRNLVARLRDLVTAGLVRLVRHAALGATDGGASIPDRPSQCYRRRQFCPNVSRRLS